MADTERTVVFRICGEKKRSPKSAAVGGPAINPQAAVIGNK